MQRGHSIMLGIILLAMGLFTVVVSANDLPVVLSDDFSSGAVGSPPAGWIVIDRGTPDTPVVTDVMSRSAGKSLQVSRELENDYISNRIWRSFTPLTERAVVTFWFNTEDVDRSLLLGIAGTNEGSNLFGASTGAYIVLRNGAVQAYSDGAYVDGALYEPNTWHKVTIDIDVAAGSFDIYLDDDSEPGNLQPLKFRNAGINNIAGIGIGFQGATPTKGHKTVYIDDLTIAGK